MAGVAAELAIFTGSDRRPIVTPPVSLEPPILQRLAAESTGVTIRRRFTLHLHASAAEPMAQRAHHQCDRTAARGVQAEDQDADRAAICRDCCDAVLGFARLRADQHAQRRWLANARYQAHRSAN